MMIEEKQIVIRGNLLLLFTLLWLLLLQRPGSLADSKMYSYSSLLSGSANHFSLVMYL